LNYARSLSIGCILHDSAFARRELPAAQAAAAELQRTPVSERIQCEKGSAGSRESGARRGVTSWPYLRSPSSFARIFRLI